MKASKNNPAVTADASAPPPPAPPSLASSGACVFSAPPSIETPLAPEASPLPRPPSSLVRDEDEDEDEITLTSGTGRGSRGLFRAARATLKRDATAATLSPPSPPPETCLRLPERRVGGGPPVPIPIPAPTPPLPAAASSAASSTARSTGLASYGTLRMRCCARAAAVAMALPSRGPRPRPADEPPGGSVVAVEEDPERELLSHATV